MRKLNNSIIVLVLLLSFSVTQASYDYTIEDGYFTSLTLHDYETLLMTGGGAIR